MRRRDRRRRDQRPREPRRRPGRHDAPPDPVRGRLRLLAGIGAGIGWVVALPVAADAVDHGTGSWAGPAFTLAALTSAGLWWLHQRERRRRLGIAGAMAGWLLLGSIALFGVAGGLWMLVAVAVVASAVTYGLLLLVGQARAPSPARELLTGLSLFAGGAASLLFVLTSGIGAVATWWLPAHVVLGLGLGAATAIGAAPMPEPEDRQTTTAVSR